MKNGDTVYMMDRENCVLREGVILSTDFRYYTPTYTVRVRGWCDVFYEECDLYSDKESCIQAALDGLTKSLSVIQTKIEKLKNMQRNL